MIFLLLFYAALRISATYAEQVLVDQPTPPSQTNYSMQSFSSWPVFDPSTYINTTQEPTDELRRMLAEVDPKRIEGTIHKLASFGTRHTMSSQKNSNRGIGAARDWIASEMRRSAAASNGQMTISIPSYEEPARGRISSPTRISNVLATLRGSVDPKRIYVISGHYDSMCSNVMDFKCDAPGANDDASGTAVVLELVRILATKTPRATIIFAAVAGEEQGLLGSKFLAQTLKSQNANVAAMLNNDIVGSPHGSNGQSSPHVLRLFSQGIPKGISAAQLQQILRIGGENDGPTRQLARYIVDVASNNATEMAVEMIYRTDRYGRGGDHQSFLDQGYTAVRFTEPHENFAHQHQNVRLDNGLQYGDLPQFVEFDYVARVARVNLASLFSLAMAPGRIPALKLDTGGMVESTRLSWTRPTDADDIQYYEVVWRPTTSPVWTNVKNVGRSTSAVLEVSKDNVMFGVRAVGHGYKSPVTAAGWDLSQDEVI